jgi:hypothetical protein
MKLKKKKNKGGLLPKKVRISKEKRAEEAQGTPHGARFGLKWFPQNKT